MGASKGRPQKRSRHLSPLPTGSMVKGERMQRDAEEPRSDLSTEPNASKRRIRVFILDDHELVRRGIRESFELEPDLVVVGQAEHVSGAVDAIRASHPNVALLDVRLPDGDGI